MGARESMSSYFHTDIKDEAKVKMSIENAYMLKKQLSLNLHILSCQIICEHFSSHVSRQQISLDDYSSILARLGLLNEDFPKVDTRFDMFYCKIATVSLKQISVLPVLISLIMLASGTHELKSRLIVD